MEHTPVILVVDDEQAVLDMLTRFASRVGFDVVACGGGHEAIETLRRRKADVALVDLHMPDVNGLDVLRAIRDAHPLCQTILMTGYASIDSAVEAVKLGATDYLSKPLDLARLERWLRSIRDDLDRRRALLEAEANLAERLEFQGMVGRSPVMQQLFTTIRRVAPHLRTALIVGETGTGKELVARALHAVGPRADRPLVVIECSAVREASFEVDLFGAAAGAIPGSPEARAGLFEKADGGVVFLDEVAELPLAVQARLLRVIELGELHRVGALDDHHIDVQVIAATQRDLRADVAAGRFRSDLLYRLNSIELAVPPLRERREDIPYLTASFVRTAAARLGRSIRGVTAEAEALLSSSSWEGNVRELKHVIERTCLLTDGEFISDREVGLCMPPPAPRPAAMAAPPRSGPVAEEDRPLSTVEREHILRALQRAAGNKKAAARMLGVSRRALYRRLERLDLGSTISRRKISEGAGDVALPGDGPDTP
jgi:DNA-binding NtrC family response regulator